MIRRPGRKKEKRKALGKERDLSSKRKAGMAGSGGIRTSLRDRRRTSGAKVTSSLKKTPSGKLSCDITSRLIEFSQHENQKEEEQGN